MDEAKRGRVHVYCGDGKGKTTAALGLCVRAAGAGYRVIVAQFLKSRDTGELKMLEKLGVTVRRVEGEYGFTWTLGPEEKEKLTAEHNRVLKEAFRLCGDGERALLVLDEMAATYQTGLIDREGVLRALRNRPAGLELVLTGRDPAPELTELADYITEMRKIKHPMDEGLTGRKGIEF